MGGEWIFSFSNKDLSKFDLNAYQKMLIEIKQQYEKRFAEEAASEHNIKLYGNVSCFWCSDDHIPPKDNIFARFGYNCTRTRHQQFHGSDECKKGPSWCLFWDPTILVELEDRESDVHARCAPDWFKRISNDMQNKLQKAFPKNFDVYWGDGMSGYNTDFGNDYWDCRDSDVPDYYCCDEDCGYCGKCVI